MGPVQSVVVPDDRVRSVLAKLPEAESYRLMEPHRTLKYLHVYDSNNPIEPGYYASFSTIDNIGGDLDPDLGLEVAVIK